MALDVICLAEDIRIWLRGRAGKPPALSRPANEYVALKQYVPKLRVSSDLTCCQKWPGGDFIFGW